MEMERRGVIHSFMGRVGRAEMIEGGWMDGWMDGFRGGGDVVYGFGWNCGIGKGGVLVCPDR